MKKYVTLLMLLCICSLLILNAYADLSPSTLGPVTLNPGESVSESKEVSLTGVIPKADIVFAFDLTGSMGDDINVVKAQAINIMGNISLLVSDAEYGVMSFMDYPHAYSSYGYSATYGYSGDYAYRLDLSLTSDKTQVSNAINALVIGYGADGPEDYTRVMYESYADAAVGWRAGSRRILIMFGDAVPHDDNLNEGVPGKAGNYSTGGDPGRDEVMFTADDLDLQTVLANMAANKVVLLYVQCANPYPGNALDYWTYWTNITGGAAYPITNANQIPTAIQALVGALATHINVLTLKAEAGYESWLTSVTPPSYTSIDIPPEGVNKTFDITITVPIGTLPGTYTFHIIADGDGVSYGEQEVTIIVPTPEFVIPEVPIGTILASVSMIIGFMSYFFIPKFKRKQNL